MKEVWGSEISATYRTIDVHIRRIREKIGEGLITTVKGIGYKLEHRLPEAS
jgi:two-component system, OmpR family, alkaline phosphatase synthesis response regulator PhoP